MQFFFSRNRYEPMVEWLRLIIHSLETWVRGHFEGHWARQCTDTSAFYIAALSLYIFFLDFVSGDLAMTGFLTLNMNIRLPLFWSTWSQARGPDSVTCAGLSHGCDYSDCRASELKLQKCLATVFFFNCRKILLNNGPQWGFSNPHPLDCFKPWFRGITALKCAFNSAKLCLVCSWFSGCNEPAAERLEQ